MGSWLTLLLDSIMYGFDVTIGIENGDRTLTSLATIDIRWCTRWLLTATGSTSDAKDVILVYGALFYAKGRYDCVRGRFSSLGGE